MLQNGKFADTYTTSRLDALNTKERSRREEKIEERAFADRYDFKLRKRILFRHTGEPCHVFSPTTFLLIYPGIGNLSSSHVSLLNLPFSFVRIDNPANDRRSTFITILPISYVPLCLLSVGLFRLSSFWFFVNIFLPQRLQMPS